MMMGKEESQLVDEVSAVHHHLHHHHHHQQQQQRQGPPSPAPTRPPPLSSSSSSPPNNPGGGSGVNGTVRPSTASTASTTTTTTTTNTSTTRRRRDVAMAVKVARRGGGHHHQKSPTVASASASASASSMPSGDGGTDMGSTLRGNFNNNDKKITIDPSSNSRLVDENRHDDDDDEDDDDDDDIGENGNIVGGGPPLHIAGIGAAVALHRRDKGTETTATMRHNEAGNTTGNGSVHSADGSSTHQDRSVTLYDGVDYGSSGSLDQNDRRRQQSTHHHNRTMLQHVSSSSTTPSFVIAAAVPAASASSSSNEYEGVDYSDKKHSADGNTEHQHVSNGEDDDDVVGRMKLTDLPQHRPSTNHLWLDEVHAIDPHTNIVDAIIEEDNEDDEQGKLTEIPDPAVDDVNVRGGDSNNSVNDWLQRKDQQQEPNPKITETVTTSTQRRNLPSCEIPITIIEPHIHETSTIPSHTLDLCDGEMTGKLINLDSTSDVTDNSGRRNVPSNTVDLLIKAVGEDDDDDESEEGNIPDISGGLGSDKSSLLHFESSDSSKGSQGSYADQVPALSGSASTNKSYSERAAGEELHGETHRDRISAHSSIALSLLLPPPPPPPTPPPLLPRNISAPVSKVIMSAKGATPKSSHLESRSAHRSRQPDLLTPTTRTYHTAYESLDSDSDDLDDILGANGEPVRSDLDEILGERQPGELGADQVVKKQSSLEETLGPYHTEYSTNKKQHQLAPVNVSATAGISLHPRSPASLLRTPTESRRAIEGISKALAERKAVEGNCAWSAHDRSTGAASILPEPSTASEQTKALVGGHASTDPSGEEEDDKSKSWRRSSRSRYTTATSLSQSYGGDDSLSHDSIEYSMRQSRGVSATPSSRPAASKFTFSHLFSTFLADDEVSPSSAGGSFSTHSTSRRTRTDTGTRSSRMTTSSHTGNALTPGASQSSRDSEEKPRATVDSDTRHVKEAEQCFEGTTEPTRLQDDRFKSGTRSEEARAADASKPKYFTGVASHCNADNTEAAALPQSQQPNSRRPLSPQAQKLAESILARTRSRADPDALLDKGPTGADQNSNKAPRSNMIKLTTQDEGLIESTAVARKRVGAAQLLSIGLASFLIAFMGGFWAQSSCYLVSSIVAVENSGDSRMRFGIWKYSPVESISQGYSYCSPYDSGNAPWLGRLTSLMALFGGLFSLLVLWIYLVLGRSDPRTWKWAIMTAATSGMLQLSTVFSVLMGPVCRQTGCSLGPACIVSIVGSLMYFMLAYEMLYNRPVCGDADENIDDGLFSSQHTGQRSQSLVANLEMADFEDGVKAYVQRLTYGNSDPVHSAGGGTLEQIQYQLEYQQQDDRGASRGQGSYEPPSAIV